MPNAIAFFPWVAVDVAQTIGPLRLLPYQRKKLPGNLPEILQVDIDDVLSAYSPLPRKKIQRATILEYGDWNAGADLSSVETLFRVRTHVAFSALSSRRLFQRHGPYCNTHSYALVLQRFHPGEASTFAFSTRRIDGGTTNLWSSDEFSFHPPHHVTPYTPFNVDQQLLGALLASTDSSLYEAVNEFNGANTDSPDVPIYVNVVMMKSAFEWLFGIGQKVNDFWEAISNSLRDVVPEPFSGPISERWTARFPKATRPLEAWAREFCDVRGASAHGTQRGADRHVWSEEAHLAFCALLFPLLVKKRLSDAGDLEMEKFDAERLKRIDSYLMCEPFIFNWNEAKSTHPWQVLENEAMNHARSAIFYPKLLQIVKSLELEEATPMRERKE
jgi:hypothetical protein